MDILATHGIFLIRFNYFFPPDYFSDYFPDYFFNYFPDLFFSMNFLNSMFSMFPVWADARDALV